MHRPRAHALLASAVLCTGLLLATTACSGTYLKMGPPAAGATTSGAAPASPASTAPPSPAVSALTAAQAQSALVTAADLGEPWGPTQGAATWRDTLLKARTTNTECQHLLDVLYADELLGAGTRAVIGLDDFDTGAQLRYQVATRPRADVDRTVAWLRTLPLKCARFTATTTGAGEQYVQVLDRPLPETGDDRQGLRVTLTGPVTEDTGEATVLTLDVAVVRVGDDALAVTDGALGEIPAGATAAAVQWGAQRLAEVRKQGRVLV
ncbi:MULTISPECIES: hypothetical protein [unclassified Streptomyces]|uniref:hypothetical protein n=1 Tax=unclassified Streptomyces TaxID=2593676 RepID=UPI001F03A2DD|nr:MULTISPECIES: hypothetical protein [unclassified Streptomyces]MCH0563042.1 hypothetical protein [Streptomyces sp. MUM 2J]MCH0573284.1 hypothetical protein [Streptomyces sp. MUM 136J]